MTERALKSMEMIVIHIEEDENDHEESLDEGVIKYKHVEKYFEMD